MASVASGGNPDSSRSDPEPALGSGSSPVRRLRWPDPACRVCPGPCLEQLCVITSVCAGLVSAVHGVKALGLDGNPEELVASRAAVLPIMLDCLLVSCDSPTPRLESELEGMQAPQGSGRAQGLSLESHGPMPWCDACVRKRWPPRPKGPWDTERGLAQVGTAGEPRGPATRAWMAVQLGGSIWPQTEGAGPAGRAQGSPRVPGKREANAGAAPHRWCLSPAHAQLLLPVGFCVQVAMWLDILVPGARL